MRLCYFWIAHVIFKIPETPATLPVQYFSIVFMASEQEINKRLRSLHQDFDFLLDNNVISEELYDDLTRGIPRRNIPPPPLSTTILTNFQAGRGKPRQLFRQLRQ